MGARRPGPRPGYYLKNFYDEQPALNFGYGRLPTDEPWREPVDAPGPRRNRQALRDIMAFWLDRGVAGFRVDMAFSLVKDDAGFVGDARRLWHEMRRGWRQHLPGRRHHPGGRRAADGARTGLPRRLLPRHRPGARGAVRQRRGGHDPRAAADPAGVLRRRRAGVDRGFLERVGRARAAWPERPILLASADHDFSRLAGGAGRPEQLGAAFTFLLTWGTVPSIYYGDEIGMRYQPGLPDVEGSVIFPGYYNRAGCRTPMQWDDTANAGFSTAPPEALYLPIDPDPDRPTVAAQRCRPGLDAPPGARPDRPAAYDSGARRTCLDRGAQRRLPVRLPARWHPPRRGEPAAGAGRLALGRAAAVRALACSRAGRDPWPTAASSSTASATASTPWPPTPLRDQALSSR